MADINARTRLLVGTTANWAASDLVLGDGEVVLERAGTAVKMKAGNGTARYSQLPFLTMTPIVPPEYLTQDEGDARYVELTDTSTTPAAGKVPVLDGTGKLPAAMVPLPPAIDVTTGPPDAGKLVKTAASGKIDPSLITITTGTYRGLIDGTFAVPGGGYLAGDYFINTGTGVAHASWGLPAGTQLAPQQQLVYNGTKWDVIGASSGTLVRLPDGTVTAPGLAFTNDSATGLWRPGANALALAVAGVDRLRLTDQQLLVRDGGVYGGAGALTARDGIVLESNSMTGLSFLVPNTQSAGLVVGDPQDNGAGYLVYSHVSDQWAFGAGAGTKLVLDVAYLQSNVPVRGPDGTAALPGLGFATAPDWGLYRAPGAGMGFAVGGEKGRFTTSADAQFLVGTTVAHGAGGRGLIEVNGALDASLGMDVAGVLGGWLLTQGPAGGVILGSEGSRPLAFWPGGAGEAGRFPVAAVGEKQFLVGGTLAALAQTGRGLVEVNGATQSALGLSVAGVGKGTALYAAGALWFGTLGPTGGALILQTNDTERARIAADGTFTYQGVEVGWRRLPQSVQTTNYTFVATDVGKWYMNNGSNVTFTIPAAIFVAGDTITVANNHATDLTIAVAGGGNLVSGTGAAGLVAPTRKLSQFAVVTLLCAGMNWFVLGQGIKP